MTNKQHLLRLAYVHRSTTLGYMCDDIVRSLSKGPKSTFFKNRFISKNKSIKSLWDSDTHEFTLRVEENTCFKILKMD